jgi:hypothetical protein
VRRCSIPYFHSSTLIRDIGYSVVTEFYLYPFSFTRRRTNNVLVQSNDVTLSSVIGNRNNRTVLNNVTTYIFKQISDRQIYR